MFTGSWREIDCFHLSIVSIVSTERNKITFDKYNRKPKGIEYCLHDVKQVGQQRGHN